MSKKYYKVVNPLTLTSCCTNWHFPEQFRVKYKVGLWTKPTIAGTRLFVFNDLQDAKDFCAKNYMTRSWDIYECVVKNPRKDVVANVKNIKEFWEIVTKFRQKKKGGLRKAVSDILMDKQPTNVWSGTEVKLIKQVK